MAEIQEWLKATGLEMYFDKFISDGWDTIASVILMTEDDLTSIGVDKVGHRRHILSELSKIRDSQLQDSCRPSSLKHAPSTPNTRADVKSGMYTIIIYNNYLQKKIKNYYLQYIFNRLIE